MLPLFFSGQVFIYSSDPAYAIPFSHGDQQLIPVLECSVKTNSYSTNRCTVTSYTPHPGDDINALEWQIENPADVEINAILLITKIKSIAVSKEF